MPQSLPVVDDRCDPIDRIEIPIPCQVPWDSMAGDDRVRHCAGCRQNVYNIISFSRPEALRLLAKSGGNICLRIYRRPDGTVMTDDCRARLRAARKRGVPVFIAVLLLVLWAQLCAQVVGLIGLRRLFVTMGGRSGMSTGIRDVAPALGEPTLGAPPPPPEVTAGMPIPRAGTDPAPPGRRALTGKRAPRVLE